jgi:hypothetical protein
MYRVSGLERVVVPGKKLQALRGTIEVGALGGITFILSVKKLYDTTFSVSNREVVANFQFLQMLDQTTLQIPGTRGFDCRIYKTFPARHAVKIIL